MTIIAIKEKDSGGNEAADVPYYVFEDVEDSLGLADAIDAANAQAAIDAPGSPPTGYRYRRLSNRSMRVNVLYSPLTFTPVPEGEETLEYSFNFQAKSKYVYYPLEYVSAWAHSGALMDGGSLKNYVNVTFDGTQCTLVGMQVDPLPETDRLIYTVPNALVTPAYRLLLRGMCGAFNNAAYNGAAQGELQLVSVSGQARTNSDWQLSFGFGYAPTRLAVQLGSEANGIEVGAVRPSCVLWSMNVPDVEDNILVIKPLRAFVQRVWDEYDFDDLALPL